MRSSVNFAQLFFSLSSSSHIGKASSFADAYDAMKTFTVALVNGISRFDRCLNKHARVLVNDRRTNRDLYRSLVRVNRRSNTALVGVRIRIVRCLSRLFPRLGVSGRYDDSHSISCVIVCCCCCYCCWQSSVHLPRLFSFLRAFAAYVDCLTARCFTFISVLIIMTT